MSAIFLATLCLLVLVCLAAVWRGGVHERIAAGLLVLAWIGRNAIDWDGRSIPWLVIAIDAGLALVFLYVAIFTRRTWALFAAGFVVLLLATHTAFAMNLQLEQWSYITAYYIWSIALIISLASGCLWSSQRNRR